MADSAAARVAEFLRHPDDLKEVNSLRQKFQREKAGIDAQLKAGVQAQIEVTLQGLHSLSDAKKSIGQINENIQKIGNLSIESKEAVNNFDKINNLSRVLQNFDEVQKFVDNFNTLSEDLREIRQLMAEDGPFDISNTYPNLIRVHYLLSKLRDIQDEAMFHASKSTQDVQRTISRHFAPLDEVVQEFDAKLFDIADCVLEIIREGDRSVIVRVAKIIVHEQEQDLVAEISNDISTSKTSYQEDKLLMSTLQSSSHRRPRYYYDRFFKAVEKSIAETFKNCAEHYENDPDSILDGLEWIFADLAVAKVSLIRCVPAHWNIFDKYVHYYHYQVYLLLESFIRQEPAAATILHILDYVKEYYESLKELGVHSKYTKEKESEKELSTVKSTTVKSEKLENGNSKEDSDDVLYPPLLDDKIDIYYDEYLSLIVSKLQEWYTSFASTEKENFIYRQVPPDIIGDKNYYGLEGEQVMFKLITQQIDVSVESGQGRILAGCIQACADILMTRQKDWEKTMQEQVMLQLNDTATDESQSTVPGGLTEYIIALANDQIRAADFTEAISSQRSVQVSKKYRGQVVARLNEASDGFISLAKQCLSSLYKIMFNDLSPAYKELFSSSAWYKGRPVRQISDTILEYALDAHEHMNPLIFDQFMEDLLAGIVLEYLRSMGRAGTLSISKAIDRVRLDVEVFYELFTKPEFNLGEEIVQYHFSIFEHIIATWESPAKDLIERFIVLRHDFWDAPLDLFEKMIKARKDVDNKTAREIMSSVRSEALQHQPAENMQPTFLADFKP